ncbi:MAG: hypothetical protein GY749_30260 [Desulfobacteraceae bacterium]|nr:hypothetical protein [Desulfobacteraceae bacterium]
MFFAKGDFCTPDQNDLSISMNQGEKSIDEAWEKSRELPEKWGHFEKNPHYFKKFCEFFGFSRRYIKFSGLQQF